MTHEEIIELVKSGTGISEVIVKSDGSHYQILAIDDMFEAMSRVKRQQTVSSPLSEKIADGTIHALTIKTFSQTQWQREKLFHQ